MSHLIFFLNTFLVLIATTTSLTEHNPKPKPRPNKKPNAFVLPVVKDTTGNYYTNVAVGKPPLVISLDIDVSGESLWFQCKEKGYNSTTYAPVLCGSSKCKEAKGECSTCSDAYSPSCRNDTCIGHFYYGYSVTLLEDDVTLSYTSPSGHVASKLTPRMPLTCMYNDNGIDIQGIIGLGNGSMSFANRLVSSYKIPFKVALCLPSKTGKEKSGLVYIGGGPYVLPPNGKDVSRLFVSTPLIRYLREDIDDLYYIDVKSIEVNGKRISFDREYLAFNKSSKLGGTMIGGNPYTYVSSSIYRALLKVFSRNAEKREPVAPFDDCFSSNSFGGKKTPVISLVLGGGAKWNIYGPNSLVKVNKSVVCLAFLKEDEGPFEQIRVGKYQMQDNLVEFDLEASTFSITSSLLLHNASCSRPL